MKLFTMTVTELDTFVTKFYHLWSAGLNAHLDVKTHAGNAWVSLHLDLGPAPGPLFVPHHLQSVPRGGARLRRRQRRAAARKEAAEAVKNKAEEDDKNKAEEALKNKAENVVSKNAVIEEDVVAHDVVDEICDDNFYNVGSEHLEKDDYINLITIEAEGDVILEKEILKSVLIKAGIMLEEIKSKEQDVPKAHVKIKRIGRKKLQEASYLLKVNGLKMEILDEGSG